MYPFFFIRLRTIQVIIILTVCIENYLRNFTLFSWFQIGVHECRDLTDELNCPSTTQDARIEGMYAACYTSIKAVVQQSENMT